MASWQAIPPTQKPTQMRPRVPLSNPENTHGPNAHAQSHDWLERSVSTPIRAAGRPPGPGWGTHNIKPHAKVSHYHRPTPPSPHSRTQQQRSALPVATPALCFVLRLCVVLWVCVQRTEHKSTTKQKTHTAIFCVHFKKTATQTKQTNAVSEVTHGCSVAVLGPAVAVAAPSRNAV